MVQTARYPVVKTEHTALAVVIFRGEYCLRTGIDLDQLNARLIGDERALQDFEVLTKYGGIGLKIIEPLLRHVIPRYSIDQKADLKLALDQLMAQLQLGKKLKSNEIMAKLERGEQMDLGNLEALLD